MGRMLYAVLIALVLGACGAASAPSQQQTGPTSAPGATPPAGPATPTPTPYDY